MLKKVCIILIMLASFSAGIGTDYLVTSAEEAYVETKVGSELETSMIFASIDE